MPDKYPNFIALSKEKVEGRDYLIPQNTGGEVKTVIVIAPLGGKIELGTSEIAREIAGLNNCLYLFEGLMKRDNFKDTDLRYRCAQEETTDFSEI